MVEVVWVSQIFGVLVDAAAVVQELGPVDHVRDLGDVELVQLSEWGEHVESLVLVVGDFRVVDLDGLVGLPEVNLTVVAQVSVVVQGVEALTVVRYLGALDCKSVIKKNSYIFTVEYWFDYLKLSGRF